MDTESLKSESLEDSLIQPIFKDGLYSNPFVEWEDRSFVDGFKILYKYGIPKLSLTKAELDEKVPIVRPDFDLLKNPKKDELQVTWLGHASALVQMEGVNFLTDPVFCDRASPVSFMGPKRFRETPLKMDELPNIDFVVISHDHYDHLDVSVVKHLGDKSKWYVPKGLKTWFLSKGVKNVEELSWWEKSKFNDDIEVTCTPCQHWSKRNVHERNTALWGSWVIKGKHKRVWFSGDTGYCNAFKSIGKQYGPFDLSLIAIGAYCPREFLKPQHVDPYEAVAIHEDLKSKFSIGVHWGTFQLTLEPVDEPPKLLFDAMQKKELDTNAFIVTKIGQVYTVPSSSSKLGLKEILEE